MQHKNDSILPKRTKSIVVATIFHFVIEIVAVMCPSKMFNLKLSNKIVIGLERQSLSFYCIRFDNDKKTWDEKPISHTIFPSSLGCVIFYGDNIKIKSRTTVTTMGIKMNKKPSVFFDSHLLYNFDCRQAKQYVCVRVFGTLPSHSHSLNVPTKENEPTK